MKKYNRLRIEITGRCNLLCKYCYNEKFNSNKVSDKELSFEEIKKLIDEGIPLGVENVLLIGGEPLLHPNIIQILDYIKNKNLSLSITSNGTIITDAILNKLKESKISRISISLDGLRAHDEVRIPSKHEEILENIKRLLTITPHIHVLTVINEKSKGDILELYEILKQIKIEEWAPSHVFVHGRFLDNKEELGLKDYDKLFEIYQELLKKFFEDKKPFRLAIHNVYNSEVMEEEYESFDLDTHPCNYYFEDTLAIKPNSDLVLCPNDPSIKENIRENDFSLKKALEKRNRLDFFNIKVRDIKECPDCRYLHLCGGGCRSEAKRFLGEYFYPDPISCIFMKNFEEKILPVLPLEERERFEKIIIKSKPFPIIKGKNIQECIEDYKKIKK
jgi:radical SAM protein with 4Fe4S-binding SPASM domain